jgi:predicted DNA-binding transcriptional regulator AlpA
VSFNADECSHVASIEHRLFCNFSQGASQMSTHVDEWLMRRDAAKYIGVSFSTLAHMASRSMGPRYHLYGNRARYLKSDLDEWMRSQVVEVLPLSLQRFENQRRTGGYAPKVRAF